MRDPDQSAFLGAFLRDSLLGLRGVEIDLPEARVDKARLPIADETPVALVDATAHGSGRAGFLITSEALWVIADKRRIALSEIVSPPRFDASRGLLDTTAGRIALPPLARPESRDALVCAVEAVIAFFAGARSTRVDELVRRGPVSAAVYAHLLQRAGVMAEWAISESRLAALRPLLAGMDHLEGERVLAVIEETSRGREDEGVAITDHRFVARRDGETRAVRLSALTAVEVRRADDAWSLRVKSGESGIDVEMRSSAGAAEDLARLLDALLHVPPESRIERGEMPARPTAEEATLAAALSARGGLTPAGAADLCTRLVVSERNQRYGRGARAGKHLSPLSLLDLKYALTIAMGAPIRRREVGHEHVLDFSLRRPLSARGAPSRRALSVLAPIGFEWVSVPKGPTIATVRVTMTDLVGATGFSVVGLHAREETAADLVFAEVERGLPLLERELLRRRAVFGLDVSPAQLAEVKNDVLARRIAELREEC